VIRDEPVPLDVTVELFGVMSATRRMAHRGRRRAGTPLWRVSQIYSELDFRTSSVNHERMPSRATPRRGQKSAPATPHAARLVHVRLPGAVHRALRIHVAAHDTSIQDWVAALIARELGSPRVDKRSEEGH
jgi:hypothetical protein